MEASSTVVGINVSKAHLNVALHPSADERVLPNTSTSIETLVSDLEAISPRVIALESTDGDEWPVVRAFLKTMLPVMVVSPAHVRQFAMRAGLLSEEAIFLADGCYGGASARTVCVHHACRSVVERVD